MKLLSIRDFAPSFRPAEPVQPHPHFDSAIVPRDDASIVFALEPLEARVLLSVTLDSAGWTKVTPSTDSRVIYVSSSQGNDSNNGLSATTAVKSLSKAVSLVRNGMPDQVLLKRGDVWYESLGSWNKSGRSQQEPILISSYGTAGARPVLRTGATSAITTSSGDTVSNVAIIGLDFHAHTRDPDFSGSYNTSGNAGIRWYSSGANLLLEDVRVQSYRDNIVIQSSDGMNNFQLRRSEIIGAYSTGSHSQGLFTKNVHGILLDGNLFDHNGWNEKISGANATIFNHNVYIQVDSTGLVARNNIFSRASSHGLQARPGGIIENNVFLRNPMGLSYGAVYGGSVSKGMLPPNGVTGRVVGNVFFQGNDISSTMPRGVAIELGNINTALVSNNTITQDDSAGTAGAGLRLDGTVGMGIKNLTLSNNVVYSWSNAMRVDDGTYSNVVVRDNKFHDPVGKVPLARFSDPASVGKFSFVNNQYYNNNTSWFRIGSSFMTLATWKTKASDNGVANANPNFPDPSRTIADYNQSLGNQGGLDAFMNIAGAKSHLNWSPAYLAASIARFFQAGFASGTVQPPVTQPVTSTVSVSTNSAFAYEQNRKAANFILTRTGDLSKTLTVDYNLSGKAANGVDYGQMPASVVFTAGAATATVTISPIDDNLVEGNETVVLTLAASSVYDIGQGAATITIVDNAADTGAATTSPALVVTDSSSITTNRQMGLSTTDVGQRSYRGRFQLANTGDGVLNVSNFKLAGNHVGDFEYTILNAQGNVVSGSAFSIAAGQTFTIEVTFVPTQGGARTAAFTFNTNDPAESQVRLGVAGLGVGAILSLPALQITDSSGSPDNRMLGLSTTDVGQRSYRENFQLANTGDGVLNVSNFKIAGAHPGDFEYRILDAQGNAISGNAFSIAVGQTFTIELIFVPTQGGVRRGMFTFNTNDPAEAQVTLNFAALGVGQIVLVPQLQITDSSGNPDNRMMGLSTTRLGDYSYREAFTLSNTGDSAFTVENLRATGTNPGDFTYSVVDSLGNEITGSSFDIAAGDSIVIWVRFEPTQTGTRLNSFTFDVAGLADPVVLNMAALALA